MNSVKGFRGAFLDLYPGSGFDPTISERAITEVNSAIFTIKEGRLLTLLVKRHMEPFRGHWGIPGSLLLIESHESLDECAHRCIIDETGLDGIQVKQFGTYDHPSRSTQWRVISTVYYTAIPWSDNLLDIDDMAMWYDAHDLPSMAFDHQQIIHDIINLMNNQRESGDIAFRFLPSTFTVADAKSIHLAISNGQCDTRNFHRWFTGLRSVIGTNKRRKTTGRDAQLLTYRPT